MKTATALVAHLGECDRDPLKAAAQAPITYLMDNIVAAAHPLPRRLLRALNYPGIILEFRRAGDSWSLARQHTHLWVWGLMQAPSER